LAPALTGGRCTRCGGPLSDGECARCLLLATDLAVEIAEALDGPGSLPCDILAVLGENERARTYLAEQTWPARRLVVLKLFKRHPGHGSADDRDPLHHPHIERVLESGWMNGSRYLLRDYFAGGTLVRCFDRRRLPAADRLEALAALAGAMSHAHARGVTHRRIGVSNVLCEARQPLSFRLVDFAPPCGDAAGLPFEEGVRRDVGGLLDLAANLFSKESPAPQDRAFSRLAQEIAGLRTGVATAAALEHALRRL
jgi:hypothetical protein